MPSVHEKSRSLYKETTQAITVSVEPFYLDDQSNPDEGHFIWAYHVRIENHSRQTVQLLDRHWHIADAMGRRQEVRGTGIVGHQPVLRPGESFEYTSGAPLEAPSGMMWGIYHVAPEKGESFDINIPTFSLDSPYQKKQLH